MSAIANTPATPYYAVIFSSRTSDNLQGYEKVVEQMVQLASEQSGFLGIESARNDIGITVSYWRDLASISAWRNQMQHKEAQQNGKAKWYADYTVRICKVEREYSKA